MVVEHSPASDAGASFGSKSHESSNFGCQHRFATRVFPLCTGGKFWSACSMSPVPAEKGENNNTRGGMKGRERTNIVLGAPHRMSHLCCKLLNVSVIVSPHLPCIAGRHDSCLLYRGSSEECGVCRGKKIINKSLRWKLLQKMSYDDPPVHISQRGPRRCCWKTIAPHFGLSPMLVSGVNVLSCAVQQLHEIIIG